MHFWRQWDNENASSLYLFIVPALAGAGLGLIVGAVRLLVGA